MSTREGNSEENQSDSSEGSDEGPDSSSSDSSSPPRPVQLEPTGRDVRAKQQHDQTTSVQSGNSPPVDSDQNPSLLFNANEKGTKKQKRSDYDSDARSYEGLGFEYKRRHLPTTARRDKLLPGTTKAVDFDHEGDKVWGSRLLFETLNEFDIDSLVGWATSPTTSMSLSSRTDDVFQNPQHRNPLLSTTYDAPLPPSNIEYIRSRIPQLILKSNSDEERGRRKRKRERMERENIDASWNSSAAVAMGMYLEECITASLLPLAGLHALRCQALEAMESAETEFDTALTRTVSHPITGETVKLDMKNKIRWKEENAFQEWTLPPEEAILKLMEQGVLSNDSPYHFVPDASRCNEVPNSNALDSASWAKSYKISPRGFIANREIFDIFLPQKAATLDKESQQPPL